MNDAGTKVEPERSVGSTCWFQGRLPIRFHYMVRLFNS